MNRSTFIFIILSTCTSIAYGRTISGKILSEKDSTAIAGAVCCLIADSTQIAGTTSDASGDFIINTNADNLLTLEVSMTGYNPTEILTGAEKTIALGNIYLSESEVLRSLEVSANSVQEKHGRTIVYPTQADLRASSTSLSLFQKLPLPGLDANPIQRTISVDGGSPVILINGVPSTIGDVNALQPKSIAKIEYSRFTPARYADRGNTGLISITLKERNDGGEIYAWGRSATATAFVDANIRASYHQGASQFSLFYHPQWRNYQRVYDNTTESYIGDDFRVNLKEHDRNPFNYLYHQIRLKYDYSPNTSTLFSVTFNIVPKHSSNRLIGTTEDSQLGNYDVRNHSRSKDMAPSLDLFLKRDFNEHNAIEIQIVGTLNSSDYRRTNEYIFGNGDKQTYSMDADSRRRSLISEISYIHTFSPKTSLSAGYQNTLSHSKNTYLTSDYEPVLTENNNYIYARLGQQIGKVYLSVSSGLKLFWIKNDLNKRHFIRNLSSAQLSWNMTDKWGLSAAFSYSPVIPSLTSLTDYPQQQTPYLISNGNPDLKVSESFQYQLMPSFKYRKFNTSLLMNYGHIRNFIADDVIYLGDKKFLSQSVNARKAWAAGGSLNMRLSDIAGFGMNVNVRLYHHESVGDTWTHHLTSLSGSFNLWWNKGAFTVSYWRKFPGKSLGGHYVGKEENGDALSFEYSANKHWNFQVDWMYMFDHKGTRYPSWDYSAVNPGSRERYIKDNGNMVVLSVTYSANFGSLFRSSRRNLNNADNASSLLKM